MYSSNQPRKRSELRLNLQVQQNNLKNRQMRQSELHIFPIDINGIHVPNVKIADWQSVT